MSQNQEFDQLMGTLADEFKQDRSQRKKAAPQQQGDASRTGLVVPQLPAFDMLNLRVPEVRPANNSRAARKEAEEQERKLAKMRDATNRNLFAQASVMAVTTHAHGRLDDGAQVMVERFYKGQRYPVHKEFMAYATNKLMGLSAAGVFAIVEVHPQHMAEEL